MGAHTLWGLASHWKEGPGKGVLVLRADQPGSWPVGQENGFLVFTCIASVVCEGDISICTLMCPQFVHDPVNQLLISWLFGF